MACKMPVWVRMMPICLAAVLSAPHWVLPAPPWMRCEFDLTLKAGGLPLAMPPIPEWENQTLRWPMVCSDEEESKGAGEEGGSLLSRATVNRMRDHMRPWHMPLLGAVQVVMVHWSSFRSRHVSQDMSLAILERALYWAALQSIGIMGVWWLFRPEASTLWSIALHVANQYSWDMQYAITTKLRAGTLGSGFIRATLALHAWVTTPAIAYVCAGFVRNTRPLFLSPHLGHFWGVQLQSWLFAELCTDGLYDVDLHVA